jgi:NAD(P)-dependent dehydrogenase (short-subunit alcohol dehydrogenase family)
MGDNIFDVSNEVVVITGVSGQLGLEYSTTMLSKGAKVAGLDVKLSETCKKVIKKFSKNFIFLECDITNKSDIQCAFTVIQSKFGLPSVLINNAALDSPPSASSKENGPFENYPESSWDRVIDVNLKGTFLCCQVFGAAMAAAKKGSIINVASIYGMVSPDQNLYEYRRNSGETFFKPVAYSSSKSGIYNLTRYLAVYWASKKVRVNTLTLAGVYNDQDQEFLDVYCKRVPIGRMANPDEYNGAILYLSSEASSYMTGQNLVIDGGWTSI